jgi:Mce-associated membrane protein
VISILSRPKRTKSNGVRASEEAHVAPPSNDDEQASVDVPEPVLVESETTEPALAEAPFPEQDGVDARDEQARTDSDSADVDLKHTNAPKSRQRPGTWAQTLVYGVLPGLAMLVAAAVGYLKWQDVSIRELQTDRSESVRAATDSTIKMLSYRPDSVDNDLASARDRMTGIFRDSYTQLTRDVVIPGSKQKRISAVATVPAAASVSASHSRAVVLVFVNQSIVIGDDAPSSTASSVKVTLERVNNRWLISDFTPI